MKKQILLGAFVIATFGAFAEGDVTSTMAVDAEKSKVTWLAKKVTGEHNGEISIIKGNLEIEKGLLAGGSFEIDMNSISNKDIESAEYNQKLVGHLKSDDFFGVQKFPKATFVITAVESKGASKYVVKGDMTIKGITRQISFPTQLGIMGDKATAIATITIDRSEFEVRYGSGAFFDDLGDKMIYDEFTLTVTLVADKTI